MAKRREPDELDRIRLERAHIVECFTKYPEVLALILNECGIHTMDPDKTTPGFLPPNIYLIAFANRLLARMGTIHGANLLNLAKKYIEASNDDDLVIKRRAAQKAAKED